MGLSVRVGGFNLGEDNVALRKFNSGWRIERAYQLHRKILLNWITMNYQAKLTIL